MNLLRRAAGFAVMVGAGFAATANAAEIPDVPGGDLFGLTSGTDVGDAGSKGVAFETTTRVGKPSGGTFVVPTLKTQFAWTPFDDVQIAASPFFTGVDIDNVTDRNPKSFIGFDGLSAEASYRALRRASGNPWAVTVSGEARWARIDGATGAATNGRALTLKAFFDRPIVDGKLYAAANVQLTTGTSKLSHDLEARWSDASGSDVSLALTYQATDAVYFGAETHWLESFGGGAFNRWQGRALTVGPTAFWKISDTVTLNAAWQAQVAGRASGSDKPLNVNDFDRHAFRLKLAVALP